MTHLLRRVSAVMAVVLVAGASFSCGTAPRLGPDEEREQLQRFWQSRFRPISYRVADPDPAAAEVNERITVRDDGVLEMSGRIFGTALAQLPPREIARIAESFAGWQDLGDEYSGGNPTAEEAQTLEELSYGGKTVRVRGNPEHLPPAYTRARAALVDAATKLRQ